MNGLDYPAISPIAFAFGPLAIRWYSLAYLFGIALAWLMLWWYNRKFKLGYTKGQMEDLVFYVTMGIIIGGRLGYAVFYGGAEMWLRPWHLLELWKGGMSFHGGVLGVIIAAWLYAKNYKWRFLQATDLVAIFCPIGIFLGRIANFVNDELWGRPSDVAWAVKFPAGGYIPRHPSQLYEACLEGLVMFVVLNALWRCAKLRERYGVVSGGFVLLYGVFRIALEQFRQPDAHLGFFFGSITMGQMLSVPMVFVGLAVLVYAWVFPKKN
ncbi:MAG: prolipoprotein diacylglyceryl transferase [Alphaproteobacteria bacterium]|nr:prolipoprotein diacylglyceryl transferase [Alphaproteobacteria bacterium]